MAGWGVHGCLVAMACLLPLGVATFFSHCGHGGCGSGRSGCAGAGCGNTFYYNYPTSGYYSGQQQQPAYYYPSPAAVPYPQGVSYAAVPQAVPSSIPVQSYSPVSGASYGGPLPIGSSAYSNGPLPIYPRGLSPSLAGGRFGPEAIAGGYSSAGRVLPAGVESLSALADYARALPGAGLSSRGSASAGYLPSPLPAGPSNNYAASEGDMTDIKVVLPDGSLRSLRIPAKYLLGAYAAGGRSAVASTAPPDPFSAGGAENYGREGAAKYSPSPVIVTELKPKDIPPLINPAASPFGNLAVPPAPQIPTNDLGSVVDVPLPTRRPIFRPFAERADALPLPMKEDRVTYYSPSGQQLRISDPSSAEIDKIIADPSHNKDVQIAIPEHNGGRPIGVRVIPQDFFLQRPELRAQFQSSQAEIVVPSRNSLSTTAAPERTTQIATTSSPSNSESASTYPEEDRFVTPPMEERTSTAPASSSSAMDDGALFFGVKPLPQAIIKDEDIISTTAYSPTSDSLPHQNQLGGEEAILEGHRPLQSKDSIPASVSVNQDSESSSASPASSDADSAASERRARPQDDSERREDLGHPSNLPDSPFQVEPSAWAEERNWDAERKVEHETIDVSNREAAFRN